MSNNLLTNALSHGERHTVIRLYQENNRIIVTLHACGTALPFEQSEQMFSHFKKRQANTRGSGLGLAIIRQILQYCDGDIHFINTDSTCNSNKKREIYSRFYHHMVLETNS